VAALAPLAPQQSCLRAHHVTVSDIAAQRAKKKIGRSTVRYAKQSVQKRKG
tara:strand:+ start:54 stop:206 length:153 start_codon:yes stop_codon:yes gene_type:complete